MFSLEMVFFKSQDNTLNNHIYTKVEEILKVLTRPQDVDYDVIVTKIIDTFTSDQLRPVTTLKATVQASPRSRTHFVVSSTRFSGLKFAIYCHTCPRTTSALLFSV